MKPHHNPFRFHLPARAALLVSGPIALMLGSTAQAVDLGYGTSTGPFSITATDQARDQDSDGQFNNNTGDMSIYWRGSATDATYMHFDLGSLAGGTIIGDVSLNQTVNAQYGGQITDGRISTANAAWTGTGPTPGFTAIGDSALLNGNFATNAIATWTLSNTTFQGFVSNPAGFHGLVLSGGNPSQAHFSSMPTLTGNATTKAISVTGATDWSAAVFDSGTSTLSVSGSNNVTGGNVAVRSGFTLSVLDAATLDSGSFAGTISNSGILSFGSSANQILSGAMSGSGALVKSGSGTLTISAATYSGGTTVSAGRLVLQDTKTGTSNFITNAELDFEVTTGTRQLNGGSISGSGKLIKTGGGVMMLGANGSPQTIALTAGALIDVQGGVLRNEYGNSAWGGNKANLNVESGAFFDIWDGNTTVDAITGSGIINKGWSSNNSLTFGAADGSGTFSGTISQGSQSYGGSNGGSFSLIKIGTGTQTLSGANTYSGATTVNAGKLLVNGSISSSLLTVDSGATLGGSGTVGKTVINGTLAVGNSPGQMNFTDTLSLAGNTITEIDGNLGAGVTGGHDLVNLTGAGAAGVLTYGGTMTLDMGVIFGTGNYSWNLFDMASETGTFTGITLADQYSGALLDADLDGVWDLTSGDNTWQFTESSGALNLAVIPEPHAALLGGLGLLALLRRRRA